MPVQWHAFMSAQMAAALIYIRFKREDEELYSLFGFDIKAKYVPFSLILVHILSGENIIPDVIGILAGHIYYFLKDVCPVRYGKDVLKTPQFL